MAKPVANLGYTKNGLEISFKDLSLNLPTSWAWDFGDAQNSTVKNPVNTYSVAGFYTVQLVSTNGEGASEPLSIILGVGARDDMLNASIFELIDHYLPEALQGAASNSRKINLIFKWQLYLQPLVEVPTTVNETDVHNEFSWPGLVNNLIAQLCAYDILIQGANAFIAATGSEGSSGTITPGLAERQVKKISTGPTDTEWFQDTTAEDMDKIGKSFSNAMKVGGAIEQVKESICQLSSRVRIFLPMCGQLTYSPVLPTVHPKP